MNEDAPQPIPPQSIQWWRFPHFLIALSLALISTILLSWGLMHAEVIPFGDGRTYAQNAIELHGLLHSGQWQQFWTRFLHPSNVHFLPTSLLFWLTPTTWATGSVFGLINCLSWNLLLAVSLFGLLRLLEQESLTPAVFLLTAANNFALDPSYFFYLDLTFMSWCLLAVWLRARALHAPTMGRWAISGLVTGSVFFVKPGNAIIFVALDQVFVLLLLSWQFRHTRGNHRPSWLRKRARMLLAWWSTFVPVAAAAAYWGAVQYIVSLVWIHQVAGAQHREFREFTDVSAWLDWAYFPLVLSFFYSLLILALLLGLIVVAAGAFGGFEAAHGAQTEWQRAILVCTAITFLIVWGLFFSFVLENKLIRSLTLMLPLGWIFLLCRTPLRRLRPLVLAAVAGIYFLIAHGQANFALFDKDSRWAEVYELTGDWWNRLPAKRVHAPQGPEITHKLLDRIRAAGVTEGKVAVGTEMLFWDAASLNWVVGTPLQRRGQLPGLIFDLACDNTGRPVRRGLEGARALILVLHPRLQYSRGVQTFNAKTARYVSGAWRQSVVRDIEHLFLEDRQPAAMIVCFREPISSQQLQEFVEANALSYSSRQEVIAPWRNRRMGVVEMIRLFRKMPQ